jgi:hypothetical protein
MIFRINCISILCVCLSIGLPNTDIISSSYGAQKNTEEELQQNVPSTIDGKISDIISVPGYTYVEVETGNDKVWAAVPSTSLNIGDEVSLSTATPMQDFYSKTLQREFGVIYFVDRFISNDRMSSTDSEAAAAHGRIGEQAVVAPVQGIRKAEEGHTIAEIYARSDELSGKQMRVRGQVVKFTAGVMSTNWIRIRDGSTADELVVPTDATAAVNDIVLVEGKLVVNMDLGQGYVIPAVLEGAEITIE